MSIPPSRALLQQRDYRARKAQYVADLELRVNRAEEENAKLKREIESLRMRAAATGTMGPSPEVVSYLLSFACPQPTYTPLHRIRRHRRSHRRPSSCTS